jgi:hypothetical protein
MASDSTVIGKEMIRDQPYYIILSSVFTSIYSLFDISQCIILRVLRLEDSTYIFFLHKGLEITAK